MIPTGRNICFVGWFVRGELYAVGVCDGVNHGQPDFFAGRTGKPVMADNLIELRGTFTERYSARS